MIFKKQYYCFIAGLPDITFETTKLPFSTEDFRDMLEGILSKGDKELIDKHFLNIDNNNLRLFLKNSDTTLNNQGKWGTDVYQTLLNKVKEGHPIKNKNIPPYFETYIKEWLDEEQHTESKLWEDRMSALYMQYGVAIQNSLLAQWFEFNLNMSNIFSAIFGRKHNMPIDKIVIGENRIAKTIRNNSNARDFGLDMELSYFEQLLRISEDTDIFDRERKTDKFRWEWLEEHTVFDYFNVEYIFSYLCKLQILERWVNLNAEEGEKMFRELITKLKNDVEVSEE